MTMIMMPPPESTRVTRLTSQTLPCSFMDTWVERLRAHNKHDANGGSSMERQPWESDRWLPVLMEELGEVSRELNEWHHNNRTVEQLRDNLRSELVQHAAIVTAWIDALDEGLNTDEYTP